MDASSIMEKIKELDKDESIKFHQLYSNYYNEKVSINPFTNSSYSPLIIDETEMPFVEDLGISENYDFAFSKKSFNNDDNNVDNDKNKNGD